MKPNFISEDDLKVLLANRDRGRVRGGLEVKQQSRAVGSNPTPSPLTLLLTGQLPSGKNQVQLLFRNGKVQKYPNKKFKDWKARSYVQIMDLYRKPITRPVHLTCTYTPGDLRTRDVSGQLDALFHLLVYAKVLKDDGLVHDVTWRRQPMDRKQPRITLNLEAV